jgi:hypothetical protein
VAWIRARRLERTLSKSTVEEPAGQIFVEIRSPSARQRRSLPAGPSGMPSAFRTSSPSTNSSNKGWSRILSNSLRIWGETPLAHHLSLGSVFLPMFGNPGHVLLGEAGRGLESCLPGAVVNEGGTLHRGIRMGRLPIRMPGSMHGPVRGLGGSDPEAKISSVFK